LTDGLLALRSLCWVGCAWLGWKIGSPDFQTSINGNCGSKELGFKYQANLFILNSKNQGTD
jgi:hypothetical protein